MCRTIGDLHKYFYRFTNILQLVIPGRNSFIVYICKSGGNVPNGRNIQCFVDCNECRWIECGKPKQLHYCKCGTFCANDYSKRSNDFLSGKFCDFDFFGRFRKYLV
ncbi:hypothetical protein D3C80_1073680 [compost metagenome]